MHPHVFREVARLGEGLTTRVAAMGLLSRMRPHVSSEAASLGEGLAARVVAMGLRRFNATLPPIGVPFLVGGAGFEVLSFACRLHGCRADCGAYWRVAFGRGNLTHRILRFRNPSNKRWVAPWLSASEDVPARGESSELQRMDKRNSPRPVHNGSP
jgi:hypothetical protein